MTFTITPELKRAHHLRYTAKPDNRAKLRCRERCAWAIKSGKLTRLPCEACGEIKAEAHHEDYSKPFDVKWLCRKCHATAHHKAHCANGHPFTQENSSYRKDGGRRCLLCARENSRRHYQRKAA
jgi:hypothetical protein